MEKATRIKVSTNGPGSEPDDGEELGDDDDDAKHECKKYTNTIT